MKELTNQQLAVIENMIAGMNNGDAGEAVGIAAYTVSRWLKEPGFIAKLNERRLEIQAHNSERMYSLATKAVDLLEQALNDSDINIRLKAIAQIFKCTGLDSLTPPTQTDPEEIEQEQLFSSVKLPPEF